jgi:hypothetical protein
VESIYLKLKVNGRPKLGGDTTPPEVSWKLKYKMQNWNESRNSNGTVVIVIVVELT